MQIGECIYCGQGYQLDADGSVTMEELNRMATAMCDCEQARNAQEYEQIQTKAEENVEKLFREDLPDVASLLKSSVLPIMGGQIDQIIIKAGKVSGKVAATSDGSIKIERSETSKAVLKS
jgi:hypothetical protein